MGFMDGKTYDLCHMDLHGFMKNPIKYIWEKHGKNHNALCNMDLDAFPYVPRKHMGRAHDVCKLMYI